MYPLVTVGCVYLGIMSPSNEYVSLKNQRQEVIQANTNLARVLDIDLHLFNRPSSNYDSIQKSLEAEREKLLRERETREGYDFVKYNRLCDYIQIAKSLMAGVGIAASAAFGFMTINNTLNDRKKRKQQV